MMFYKIYRVGLPDRLYDDLGDMLINLKHITSVTEVKNGWFSIVMISGERYKLGVGCNDYDSFILNLNRL